MVILSFTGAHELLLLLLPLLLLLLQLLLLLLQLLQPFFPLLFLLLLLPSDRPWSPLKPRSLLDPPPQHLRSRPAG